MHEASIGERNKLAPLISSYCLGFSAINLILSQALAEQGLSGDVGGLDSKERHWDLLPQHALCLSGPGGLGSLPWR